jgi:hypothetical protein
MSSILACLIGLYVNQNLNHVRLNLALPALLQEALVAALTSMPQDQFELAVALVIGHHPGLQPYDDFGFDLDALDALTLRQMQVCVLWFGGRTCGC